MALYPIVFTTTVYIEAEDSISAVEIAREQVTMDDMYIYVDGNLWN